MVSRGHFNAASTTIQTYIAKMASSSPLLTKLTKRNHRRKDLESRVGKWTGTGMMKPSGTKLSSFPDPKLRQSEEQDEQDAKPPVNFPPRKRSIPYGFDFDLDEVWAPLNPHLRSLKSTSSTPSPSSSASSSSENSISGGLSRVPMQSAISSSVFGSTDADTSSRAPTARLSQKGKSQLEDTEEFAVENEDIFMQISNLNLKEPNEELEKGNNDLDAAVITNVGLPSARTLRGGASIVAKGRHDHTIAPPQSAMSNFSSYSSSSSRYSSSSSPSPSRRATGLTPGLFGENTRKVKASSSPRKSLPPK